MAREMRNTEEDSTGLEVRKDKEKQGPNYAGFGEAMLRMFLYIL